MSARAPDIDPAFAAAGWSGARLVFRGSPWGHLGTLTLRRPARGGTGEPLVASLRIDVISASTDTVRFRRSADRWNDGVGSPGALAEIRGFLDVMARCPGGFALTPGEHDAQWRRVMGSGSRLRGLSPGQAREFYPAAAQREIPSAAAPRPEDRGAGDACLHPPIPALGWWLESYGKPGRAGPREITLARATTYTLAIEKERPPEMGTFPDIEARREAWCESLHAHYDLCARRTTSPARVGFGLDPVFSRILWVECHTVAWPGRQSPEELPAKILLMSDLLATIGACPGHYPLSPEGNRMLMGAAGSGP